MLFYKYTTHYELKNSSFTYLFLIFQVFDKFFIMAMVVTSESKNDTNMKEEEDEIVVRT